VPVAIVVSQEWSPFWVGKVIPAGLAATCSIVAGWLHFRRPSERWTLFRTFQECLETDLMLYRHKAGPYRETHEPALLLIERLAYHERRMHLAWITYAPPGEEPRRPSADRPDRQDE
jgi:hypothetical protein